jgi:hypothetical protein
MQPKRVIRERFQVLEEDKTQTFRHELPAVPIGGSGGNLFFIGMEGSCRKTLARAVADRLGLAYAEAASPEALATARRKSGQAVAVTGVELSDPEAIVALRDSGKVFYIMSLASILVERLGTPDRLSELADTAARLEPHFMTAAHFILPVAATLEEMLDDVAEKARL